MNVRFKLLDAEDRRELEQILTSSAMDGEITIEPQVSGAGAGLAAVIVVALIAAGGKVLVAGIAAYASYVVAKTNAGKAGAPTPKYISINGTNGSVKIDLTLPEDARKLAIEEAIKKVGVVTSVEVIR